MHPLNGEKLGVSANHIITGILPFKFNGVCYSIHQPRYDLLQSAEEFSSNLADENKYGFWLDDNDIENILIRQGLWDKCNDIFIKNLTNTLEGYKVDLYKSYCTHPDGVKKCKHFISIIRDKINTAFGYRYSLYQWTLKYYLDNMKSRYLIGRTLHCGDQKLCDTTNPDDISFDLINAANKCRLKYMLSDVDIRKLVREEPWKTLWTIGKPNPFRFHILELTENQKLMIVFSRMYDSIMKNTNCPPDDIIEDDDALDGWMIINKREADSSRLDAKVKSTLTQKQQKGSEIFLPAQNIEDAKKIEQLNTPEVQRIKKERQAVINKKGIVKEGEFLDTRLQKQVMYNQQFLQRK